MTITVRGSGVLHEIAHRRAADVVADLDEVSKRARGAGLPVTRRVRSGRMLAPRPLLQKLAEPGLHLIAEVKRRSPSAGSMAESHDVVAQAQAYEHGGAAAISVLCEPHWFGGSLDDLGAVRRAVRIPVLAKEFVVDRRQLSVLRGLGADAVLLLASLHRARELRGLVREAISLGLEPMVEAHDERELTRALTTAARLIAINNRDLRSLEVDLTRAERLRPLVPDDRLVVAESGVREPSTLSRWRALGFDAALVGEALMRAGDPRAATAAFVTAGMLPPDIAAQDRMPDVKICGIVDESGVLAAARARVEAIGLNLVAGTPRALDVARAARLARYARGLPTEMSVVLVTANAAPADLEDWIATVDPDIVQLSGNEPIDVLARLSRPVWKTLRADGDADSTVAEARRWQAAGCARIVVDAAHSTMLGGTGQLADRSLAAQVARAVPTVLAGGLRPENVARSLLDVPAVGVDVASGVELPRTRPPRKDALSVAVFVKRARAARFDRPQAASRPDSAPAGLTEADTDGRWGSRRELGGRYVPETVMSALTELERTYLAVRDDPSFWAELRGLATDFAGRPTPLYRADRLAHALGTPARVYLKREDLAHTGAHKINNVVGQGLLARRLGKTRLIAETGAGQHGVASATVAALLGLPCVVYMGAADVERQGPNVLRMRALGAEVRSVTSGSATLKDAINEAMRDWVTNVATSHYVLGSAMGPHPYPSIVRDLQRVIGDEAAVQVRAAEGRLPDLVIGCVGGGSNAIGLFSRFIGEPRVRLAAVEAAGEGIGTGRHAAALGHGSVGIIHGARTMLLQDADGQITEAHSISAGLDYPGVGPQLAALAIEGRVELATATDDEALAAMRLVAATEGILPALEPSHAIAALPRLAHGIAARGVVLVCLSGRGDKDLGHLAADA